MSREDDKRAAMTPLRKTALVAGIFYVLTFVSIPTLALSFGSSVAVARAR